jgi:putative membrane protein
MTGSSRPRAPTLRGPMDAVRERRYSAHNVPLITILLVRLAITMAAFGITAWLLDGMDMSGGFLGYLWVALLFGIVNAILGTIIRLLTLPFILLTFGILAIFINAFLLEITDALTDNLTIDEFWWTTVWASIILAIVTVVLDFVVAWLFVHDDDDVRAATSL